MSQIRVPFFRPSVGEAEVAAVSECLRSGWLTTGPKTRAFEAAFEAAIGEGVHAIAVNSATSGLHLGLEALGVGPGDEVIVPTLTFTATAEVVRYLGATPVFADIDPDTLCLGVEAIEPLLTTRTKAIVPVHFTGRSCDMTAIQALARARGVKVMDDAAHALPTVHQGKIIGDTGADVTVFSFYANKTMTTGEGGMLVTRDPELAQRARVMRLHGIDRDVFDRFTAQRASWLYDVVAPGYKYNLTDIASAMGIVQLGRCDEFQAARTRLAARYDEAFADLKLRRPPGAAEGDTHSWHLYIIQLTDDAPVDREAFISALQDAGIGSSVHYRPLHQMTYWRSYCGEQKFPNADRYFQFCVSLPLFMAMTDAEQDYVIETVAGVLKA